MELMDRIHARDNRAIARALTLVENNDEELLAAV
jgi:putative protein kinase ArgK-like GTPase of G3E family